MGAVPPAGQSCLGTCPSAAGGTMAMTLGQSPQAAPCAMEPKRGFIRGAIDPVDVTALQSVPDWLLPASGL